MKCSISAPNAFRPCTGCALCSAVCPQDAIEMQLSANGFYMPKIDSELCIDCGLCQKVCYSFDAAIDIDASKAPPLECLSAINRNEAELKMASSGAVSIELMRQCLKQGYLVVGVAYDLKREVAVTKIAKTEDELLAFRGSKYFQSDTSEAFKAIVQDKSNQKYAIFGTPCQIYAFAKAADVMHNRNRYLLIDIFCHGCPSMLLWKKYLDSVKREMNVSDFDDIRFRSKTHGWHEFCFSFAKSNTVRHTSKYNDQFYELFFGMDTMNMACYDCVPRSSVEKTDIRIGDFWGWQFDEDTKGVSAVVLQTERGKGLLESIQEKFNCKPFSFNEIIAAQSYGKTHPCDTDKREKTIALLAGGLPMNGIIQQYRKMTPIKRRIKQTAKRVIKHLPTNIYMRLKRVIHKI